MFDFNYFSYLCFAWAFIGIVSRILMIAYGDKWNKWELKKAYSKKKPKWIYAIGIAGSLLVIYTWYRVSISDIKYDWIIAALITLTLVKISNLLFNYDKFREFAGKTLNNKKRRKILNASVFIFSVIFILLGLYLY